MERLPPPGSSRRAAAGVCLPAAGMRLSRRPGSANPPLARVPNGGRGKAALPRPRRVDAAANGRRVPRVTELKGGG